MDRSRHEPGPGYGVLATTLVTQVVAGAGLSSSTKPDLMLRMLEILDVADGHRVLEIGTGTGYNAALLCERLGADRVFSVDVDPDLVDTARGRLAAIGHRPHLDARDGAEGWAAHGPYDRIIATCSVPQIPWPWAEQLVPGGLLLADLKLGAGAGNLVALRRHAHRLEERFTARWAAFMTIRTPIASPAFPPGAPRAEGGHERTTTAPAQPWASHREVWMLAARDLPTGVTHGYLLDPDTRAPAAAALTAPDGSWCEVALDGEDQPVVRESGPTPLWRHVESAYTDWQDWGEPSWERFGLTVTPDTHTLWLDEPTHAVR